jgi:hypothetical protein
MPTRGIDPTNRAVAGGKGDKSKMIIIEVTLKPERSRKAQPKDRHRITRARKNYRGNRSLKGIKRKTANVIGGYAAVGVAWVVNEMIQVSVNVHRSAVATDENTERQRDLGGLQLIQESLH